MYVSTTETSGTVLKHGWRQERGGNSSGWRRGLEPLPDGSRGGTWNWAAALSERRGGGAVTLRERRGGPCRSRAPKGGEPFKRGNTEARLMRSTESPLHSHCTPQHFHRARCINGQRG
eukprot:gene23728-biopygen7330